MWGLYGLANTPLTAAIGGLYLAQWVVLDNHFPDIWYGGVFTLATIFLLLTSPFWGAWSDALERRKPFIVGMTVILLVAGGLLGLVATSALPAMTRVVLALVLFFVIQYFYQLSLIFYNTLIGQMATRGALGEVSGIGDFFDEVGWLLGPAALLPFATGMITLWGEPGRGQVFLPAVVIFAVLGLPMVLWFQEKKPGPGLRRPNLTQVYERTIFGLKRLAREDKSSLVFLVGFMFVSDALLTAQLYFAIYLDRVFGIADTEKFFLLATMQGVAVFSALILGRLSDRFGAKRVLILACWILFGGLFLVAVTPSLSLIYMVSAVLGVGFAGFYVTSRSLLLKISPVGSQGEYFGFYSTFQKFASVIGPLTWGAVTFLLKDYGTFKYRVAILALVLLVLVGIALMTRVSEKVSTQ